MNPSYPGLNFPDMDLFKPFHIPNPSAVIKPEIKMNNAPIGHIKTKSGIWFDFNDPKPEQVTIEDIAHALSMICRYNGHIPSFYSVAEHSCHVADWLDVHGYQHLAFAGLLHDAAEAYLGDIVNPMKKLYEFDRVYAPMEEIVENVIGDKFNVDLYPMDPIIKEADKAVYDWEVENIRTGKIKGYNPADAYKTFLAFFNHYKPFNNFTRESQVKNTTEVPNMTDAEMDAETAREAVRQKAIRDTAAITDLTDQEIAEQAEIAWDSFMDLTNEAENRLMRDIADLDASVAEVEDLPLGGKLIVDEEVQAMRDANAEKMPWSPRRALLMGAADLVDGDRNAQYGDPRQDFKRTMRYWNTHIEGVLDRKMAENGGSYPIDNILDPHDVAIMMDLLKTSRLAWSPQKEDTWMDKAGYTACGWHCAMPEEGHTH